VLISYLPHRLVDWVTGVVFGRVSKHISLEKPLAPSQAAYQTPVQQETINRAAPTTSAVA
jgi:hypothetical protein